MSSREIAELTEKQHKNVKRDIEKMLVDLEEDTLSFEHIYLDSINRQQTEYLLERDHTECLLIGLCAIHRMRVIKRWHELEELASQFFIPQTYPEALRIAAQRAEETQHPNSLAS
ncbi:Rha family transcriptional regulator [Candidatus Symbiopectobacterium sp.]|uniref:Rha family transcriptional regulator n=1 Tax=Candidatus Symbiopectobacterium sp. TaxID=2816440 RepID=UPI0025C072E0|nr:Rha family transcriptional regulator [Candidatus Symbiopectobacterium sp.]